MKLDKKQLEIILDALKEYEEKYYDSKDDNWQEVINDTIAKFNSALEKE